MASSMLKAVCPIVMIVLLVHQCAADKMSASEAFDASDSNGDNLLSKKELAEAVALTGGRKPTSKGERASLMAQLDTNRDKKIDKVRQIELR